MTESDDSLKSADAGDAAARLLGARVLVVEDSDISREIAGELLASLGVAVDMAAHGAEALLQLQHRAFDAVLMDLQMPVMDGAQATRRIRADPRHAHLPIIAITASEDLAQIERCRSAGMNDHVAKPFDIEQLAATLARWVRPRSRDGREAADAADAGAADDLPRTLPGVDLAQGLRNMAGRRDLYRRMLIKFRNTQADAARQIRAALLAGDRETATRHAHTLTGVAGSIGAVDLQAAAIGLGDAIRRSRADVEARFHDVADRLARLVAVLAVVTDRGAAVTRPGTRSPSTALAGGEALRRSLFELRRRLQEDDTSAAELIASLVARVPEIGQADLVGEIESAFGRYDFDAAVDALSRLLAALEVE